jgi:phosphate:Na+ symporter
MHGILTWLVMRTLPERYSPGAMEAEPVLLDRRLFTTPSVAIAQARLAVGQMVDNIRFNNQHTLPLLFQHNEETIKLVEERENQLDRAEVSITNYLVDLTHLQLNEQEAREATTLLAQVGVFERIGDYIIKITRRSGEVKDKSIIFSDMARRELTMLSDAVTEVIETTSESFYRRDASAARRVEPLEETVDDIVAALHSRHITRLKSGSCSIDGGVIFLEVITDYERISDHCSSVAAHIITEMHPELDAHTLLRQLHMGSEPYYNMLLIQYKDKYALPAAE